MRPRPVLHETEAETKTSYCETETETLTFVPGSVHMFNRRVPNVLDRQTWRRQLNHTGVDSVFTVKCVANLHYSNVLVQSIRRLSKVVTID